MSSFTIPTSSYNTYPTTPKYSIDSARTEMWATIKQRSASGIVSAAGLMSYPLRQWELKYNYIRSLSASDLQTIVGFYNQQNGGLTPFNFLDPIDNTATAATFGIGDGTSTMWQLMRPLGGFYEPVIAPYGTAKVFIDGVEKTATTDFSITNSGLVTFTSAPANGTVLTWTGTFYWIAAFVEDATKWEGFNFRFWRNGSVLLETRKAPGLA